MLSVMSFGEGVAVSAGLCSNSVMRVHGNSAEGNFSALCNQMRQKTHRTAIRILILTKRERW
jgi:hypothetical protein